MKESAKRETGETGETGEPGETGETGETRVVTMCLLCILWKLIQINCLSEEAAWDSQDANDEAQFSELKAWRCQLYQNQMYSSPLMGTMWGPPVISWFISPSNYSYKYYSYKYHKP